MSKLVTFDCAGTLIAVKRDLIGVLGEVAAELDIPTDNLRLGLFHALYVARLPVFHRVNLERDPRKIQEFWIQLAGDWLGRIGSDPSLAGEVQKRVDDACFKCPSRMFEVYDDVHPTLQRLHGQGFRLGVISNWDTSLNRALGMFELERYFEFALASLEEGWEKPDPRLFQRALDLSTVSAHEAVHVGDDEMDDIEGARLAGFRAVLLDRSGRTPGSIRSLVELEI